MLNSVLEWKLEKHDANSMKFTFLYGTFELDISFKDSDGMYNVYNFNLIKK